MLIRRLAALSLVVIVSHLLAVAPPSLEGTSHALLIALPSARHAEKDMLTLKQALQQSGYSAENIALLTKDVTPANVRRALAELAKGRSSRDRLLIAVCGEAIQSDKETQLLLSEDKKSTLPLAEIYRELATSKAGTRVVLLDVCRSPGCKPQELPIPAGLGVFFACEAGQRGKEISAEKGGVFFSAIARGLAGEADANLDRLVSLRELQVFVEEQVTRSVKEQTPELLGKLRGTTVVASLKDHAAGDLGVVHVDAIQRVLPRAVSPPTRQVVVFAFAGGSPLKPGDVLLQVDGKDTPSKDAVHTALIGRRPGSKVGVLVARKDDKVRLEVVLQAKLSEAEQSRLLRPLADKGDVDACDVLAHVYHHGIGVVKDEALALRYYRKAADAGSAAAQFGIGLLLDEKRDEGAITWYRKAAEQGLARAQAFLGVAYQEGHGIERDVREAVKWYAKAAEQGESDGQYALGQLYSRGLGVERDDAEAVSWFRKAVERGHAEAANSLGFMYTHGRGLKQDHAKALEYYRLAAQRNSVRGFFNVGFNYATGQGVAANAAEAAKWYRKAADRNDMHAQNNLANLYLKGRGVPKDVREAARLHRKAAEQGEATAQVNLGDAYDLGRGVLKDHEEAAKWYHEAAKQGNVVAMRMLGEMYLTGRGVRKDRETGFGWLKKAAGAGDKESAAKIKEYSRD